jgi:hypothetical protein
MNDLPIRMRRWKVLSDSFLASSCTSELARPSPTRRIASYSGKKSLNVSTPTMFSCGRGRNGLRPFIVSTVVFPAPYDTRKPEEQEYMFHILRTGSTGDIKAKVEFLIMLKQIEQILIKVTWKKMSADLAAKQISQLSLLAVIRAFAMTLGIQITKRKALQSVPIIGALVGASFDGTFVNDIGRAPYMCYRRRFIEEHQNEQ